MSYILNELNANDYRKVCQPQVCKVCNGNRLLRNSGVRVNQLTVFVSERVNGQIETITTSSKTIYKIIIYINM